MFCVDGFLHGNSHGRIFTLELNVALWNVSSTTPEVVWPYYVGYLCTILPIQYVMAVGLPPGLCIGESACKSLELRLEEPLRIRPSSSCTVTTMGTMDGGKRRKII